MCLQLVLECCRDQGEQFREGSQQPHLEDTLLNRSCELHNIPHTIVTSVRVRFGRYPCASERCKE